MTTLQFLSELFDAPTSREKKFRPVAYDPFDDPFDFSREPRD